MTEKKPRKTRKDKSVKRGKRKMKNPRLQIGSIDFRTIGTQQTMGPNLSSLIGTIASLAKQVVPFEQQISTELSKYAPRDLEMRQMIPQPQQRPDVQQAQEEEPSQTGEVRRAMGERIGRLRKEEASLFLKGKVMETKNMLMGKELQQKQMELVEQDKSMDLKRKSFLVEQVYGTTSNQGFARIQSQILGLDYTGKEAGETIQQTGGIDNYRNFLLSRAGLNPALVDYKEVKAGERGKARKDYFYNPQKADLQRAQEERPEILTDDIEEIEGDLGEPDEEPTAKTPKERTRIPYKAEFIPTQEFVNQVQAEMAAAEQPRIESEIEAAARQAEKINKKNELEELARTSVSLDSRLAQRLSARPRLPNR